MTTTTVLADNADYTLTQIADDAPGNVTTTTAFKSGSAGFNQQAMITKMAAALSALESADANWTTLTATQKDNASHLAVRVTAKLTRFALGQFDGN